MTARIKIDQVGLSAGVAGRARTDGLNTGAEVTLENTDPQGATTFHLLWGPTDDTTAEASLAATGNPDIWTFSPTAGCYGSYLIELRENNVPIERRVFGVRTPANGLLIPALNERGSRHASWDNDGSDQAELSDNNATDFNDPDLNDRPYAGYWRSLAELYRAFEIGLNFPPTLNVSGSQAINTTGNLSFGVGADFLASATSGIGFWAGGETPTGVATGDVQIRGTAEVRLNGPLGLALESLATPSVAVANGDIIINADSGIGMRAGVPPITSVGGGELSIGVAGGLSLSLGGLAVPTHSSGRFIAHATQGFVLSSDGTGGGAGGILMEATGAVSSSPPSDGIIQLNTSVAARLTGAPFFQIDEAAASTPSNAAGRGMIWVQDTAPCEARFTDDVNADWMLNVHGVAGMSAITTRTNSTTVLNAASFNAPGNTWRAGTTYRFSGMLRFARGATATPSDITIGVSVSGNSVLNTGGIATSVTDGYLGTAWVEGYLTCISTGSSGTAIAAIRVHHIITSTTHSTRAPTTISTFTLNTTQANDIDLAAVFSVAVADLSMTWQAGIITKVR